MKTYEMNIALERPSNQQDAEMGLMLSIAALVEKYGTSIMGVKECDITEVAVKDAAGKILQLLSQLDDNGAVQTMTFKVLNAPADKAVN